MGDTGRFNSGRGLLPHGDGKSRTDVTVSLVSDFFEHVTAAQEKACLGELEAARELLRNALRDCEIMSALVREMLDDL